jgi:micrococcal nuclease
METDENGNIKVPYVYRAKVVSVYDADTMTVDIDCGFGVWLHKQKLRLYGINAPEVRGPEKVEGKISRDYVRSVCGEGKSIVLQSHRDKKGKYGRWLATVWYHSHANPDGPMMNLNETLVQRGLAKTASY